MSAKRKTLAGRILRGIGAGILDGVPFVAQVVNSVREGKAQTEEAKEVPTVNGPARVLTGWLTVAGFILALASGTLDCEALRGILEGLGWPWVK
jgi:hypothetical protein